MHAVVFTAYIDSLICSCIKAEDVFHIPPVAGEPTNLTAVQQSDTSIEVSWDSPGSPATGYVIYYQPEGGAVSSLNISGRINTRKLLEGLESGVTYSISIVAVSDHLPSAVVGPVTASMLIHVLHICVSTCVHGLDSLSLHVVPRHWSA